MKAVVFSVLTGTVAAQLNLPVGALNIAAINQNDPEFAVCTDIADKISECVSDLGGTTGLTTADPIAVVECACCDGGRAIATSYSVCSDYLSEEGGFEARSQYSAYGDLYSACALQAECRGGSGSSGTTRTRVGGPVVTTTSTDDDDDRSTITSSASAEQTYATACEDMVGVFNSCSNKIDDFTELPFKDQASCYCCRGSSLTWTDQFDQYAKTCASWARTGEPETAYTVARSFATFCEQFTDACEGAATATEETTTTRGSSNSQATNDNDNDNNSDDESSTGNGNGNGNGQVTVTVEAAPTETDSSAPAVRVAMGAAFAAVLGMAIIL